MPFVAAIDDSGGNLDYLSIIIGEKEKINSLIKTLPSDFTHMADYKRKEKKRMLSRFSITGNIKICCIRYGFPDTHKKFLEKVQENSPNYKSNQRFYNIMAEETKIKLHSLFKDFLTDNGLSLEDIEFEVDNKVIHNILKHAGLKPIRYSQVHKIADCIAHANFKNWNVKGVVEYNSIEYKDELLERVIKRCFR